MRNTGSAPLAISNVIITGPNATDFRLEGQSCQADVPVGGSCVVLVRFVVDDIGGGTRSATLVVVSDALSGIGTAALSAIAPTTGASQSFSASDANARIALAKTQPKLSKARKFSLKLTCPDLGLKCSGTVSAKTVAKVSGSKRNLGTKKFSMSSGKSRTVVFVVSKKTASLLKNRKTVKLAIRVTGRLESFGALKALNRQVTLRLR